MELYTTRRIIETIEEYKADKNRVDKGIFNHSWEHMIEEEMRRYIERYNNSKKDEADIARLRYDAKTLIQKSLLQSSKYPKSLMEWRGELDRKGYTKEEEERNIWEAKEADKWFDIENRLQIAAEISQEEYADKKMETLKKCLPLEVYITANYIIAKNTLKESLLEVAKEQRKFQDWNIKKGLENGSIIEEVLEKESEFTKNEEFAEELSNATINDMERIYGKEIPLKVNKGIIKERGITVKEVPQHLSINAYAYFEEKISNREKKIPWLRNWVLTMYYIQRKIKKEDIKNKIIDMCVN